MLKNAQDGKVYDLCSEDLENWIGYYAFYHHFIIPMGSPLNYIEDNH